MRRRLQSPICRRGGEAASAPGPPFAFANGRALTNPANAKIAQKRRKTDSDFCFLRQLHLQPAVACVRVRPLVCKFVSLSCRPSHRSGSLLTLSTNRRFLCKRPFQYWKTGSAALPLPHAAPEHLRRREIRDGQSAGGANGEFETQRPTVRLSNGFDRPGHTLLRGGASYLEIKKPSPWVFCRILWQDPEFFSAKAGCAMLARSRPF